MTDRECFVEMCASEYPRFVGVLQATPGDRLEYRPHPRSRSGYELVGHLIGHEQDLLELVETGDIHHRIQVPFGGIQEAIAIYSDARARLAPQLEALNDAKWERGGKFVIGDRVVIEAPCRTLAWMLLLDAVHHRGQLSTYLRPMGGMVPAIYGPSADSVVAAQV